MTSDGVIEVRNYIDGAWSRPAGDAVLESRNPSTGQLVAVAPVSGLAEVEAAVGAARRAFDAGDWRGLPGKARAAVLLELADRLEAHAEELATMVAREMGKPMRYVRDREIAAAIDRVRFFAGAARMVEGTVTTAAPAHLLNLVLREPVGVCAFITPWNDPVDLPLRKIGAALAAGCTFVLKPASDTPAASMILFDLLDGIPGLPKGVANGIIGPGEQIGEALAADRRVNKIAFTGSSEVGRRLAVIAAERFAHVSVEGGGKAPIIVFEDADLDKAMDAVMVAAFAYSGQSCTAGTRLLVHRSIKDAFVRGVIERARTLRYGDPFDQATEIGPMVSERQIQRVLEYVRVGVDEGARLLVGGERLPGLDGPFMAPTVFDEVTPGMRIAQEEIFGPVLAVIPFDTEEEAIEIANGTQLGLAGAVWTRDVNRAIRLVKRLEVGDCWVNTHYVRMAEAPFGGVKLSGIGRELGIEGLEEYFETKRVCFDTSPTFALR